MNVEDIARQRRRCDWCGRFVKARMPQFTWYRTYGTWEEVDGEWTQTGPNLGWTTPQTLCPDCAENAFDWPGCHDGLFAELAVGP